MAVTYQDDNNWLDWMKFLQGVQQYRDSKNPKFSNAPMSPEQKDAFNFAFGRLKSLPNMTPILAPYAGARALTSNPFDLEAIKDGKIGYTPTGTKSSMDPNTLASILGGNKGGGDPTTPSNTTPGGTGTTGAGGGPGGDPFHYITSPAGSQGDPFHGMDTTASGDTDLHSVLQKGIDYINSQKTGGGNLVGMTAATVATYLGVPGILATAAGKILASLWNRLLGKKDTEGVGEQDTQDTPFKNVKDSPPDKNKRDAVNPWQNNDPWSSTFNSNLQSDPGQLTGETTGGTQGFGYGLTYDDRPWTPLPGGPRSGIGGGAHGGGKV